MKNYFKRLFKKEPKVNIEVSCSKCKHFNIMYGHTGVVKCGHGVYAKQRPTEQFIDVEKYTCDKFEKR